MHRHPQTIETTWLTTGHHPVDDEGCEPQMVKPYVNQTIAY